jgi:hypothetical protein
MSSGYFFRHTQRQQRLRFFFGKTPLDYPHSNHISSNLLKLSKNETNTVIETVQKKKHKPIGEHDNVRDLSLHIALKWHASSDEIVKLLVAHPEAVNVQNKYEGLPLHFALKQHASSDDIERLLEHYPQGAKLPNSVGNLPLHIECLNQNPTPQVVNMLIDFFPESIEVKNINGNLPKDLVDDSDLKSLLSEASLPEPKENEGKHRNKIIIDNKTGRSLRVEYFMELGFPPNFFLADRKLGLQAKFLKMSNAHRGVLKVSPGKEISVVVGKDCSGMYFNVFSDASFRNFWILHHFIKKGYTQAICGQPLQRK